jgi:hypothetical protein
LVPYSTSGREGPRFAGFAGPLRSALRVWLPSRRFPPFSPAPVLFRTGSAPGIHSSEPSPHEGRSIVSFRPDPPTVSAQPHARGRDELGAPVSGLCSLRESLANRNGVSAAAAGCSLEFRPFQGDQARTLVGIPPNLLLRAWRGNGIAPSTACTIEFRSARAGHGAPLPDATGQARRHRAEHLRAALLGFLRQYAPKRKRRTRAGYEFTSRRVTHCCRPPDDLRAWPT